jgi:Glu-tRNA(Gln) amidotransferase subunit E-like FAD-binding protein
MKNDQEWYKQEALFRVKDRKDQPESDKEMEWAIDSELNSIQSELVKQQVHEEWVNMFKETIDQANSSFDNEFVMSMVEAIQTSHRTIQSEFFLRLIKVFGEISKSDDSRFDARNEWTKEMCKRFSFCVSHVGEIDRLRNMTEDELHKFRNGV